MNIAEASAAAARFGSYVRAGDPGACMYAFRLNDGRPVSEEHRAQVLAWLARPRDESKQERRSRLRLVRFMRTAPVLSYG